MFVLALITSIVCTVHALGVWTESGTIIDCVATCYVALLFFNTFLTLKLYVTSFYRHRQCETMKKCISKQRGNAPPGACLLTLSGFCKDSVIYTHVTLYTPPPEKSCCTGTGPIEWSILKFTWEHRGYTCISNILVQSGLPLVYWVPYLTVVPPTPHYNILIPCLSYTPLCIYLLWFLRSRRTRQVQLHWTAVLIECLFTCWSGYIQYTVYIGYLCPCISHTSDVT